MFEKVLVANRGEIAHRIIKTLHKLNIEALAIYDEREKNSPYVQTANTSVSLGIGPLKDTFLNGKRIIEIAKEYACSAIHPGYGFLSENALFASNCDANGIVFIGPRPETIAKMGNKIEAALIAEKLGIPIIPQFRGSIKDIYQSVSDDFFPCLVKASAGGGGKGMRKANNAYELKDLLRRTSAEAEKYFSDGEIYMEKYLDNPRHIEVQVLADSHGNTVHLFERECSIQRRFQKIIEEAPADSIPNEKKEELFRDAIKLTRQVEYLGAGTVEFLIDKKGNHFFLEMNTRIQVEHGITELITGVDIVEEQLAIAAGESISQNSSQAICTGFAIEARLYAEDPSAQFRPSPGMAKRVHFPGATHIRIDADFQSNSEIIADFDPMVAKVMTYGETREEAIKTLRFAMKGTILQGVKNNLAANLAILNEPDFINNRISTHYLEEHPEVLLSNKNLSVFERNLLLAAGLYLSIFHFPNKTDRKTINVVSGFWRILKIVQVSLEGKSYKLSIRSIKNGNISFSIDNEVVETKIIDQTNEYISLKATDNEERVFFSWNKKNLKLSLSFDFREIIFERRDFLTRENFSDQESADVKKVSSSLRAPLNGTIIKIHGVNGQLIQKGETVLVIESMKMENEIKLPRAAFLKEMIVSEGQLVKEGDILAYLEPE